MELPKVGDTIELLTMSDPDPVPTGSTGVVTHVYEARSQRERSQIGVQWADSDRSLMLVIPPDRFRIVDRGLE